MIAASEPQEFVPSGRQQALRHPNCSKTTSASDVFLEAEDNVHVFDKFEKVSLKDKKYSNEWWILRKSPTAELPIKEQHDNCNYNEPNKSYKVTGAKLLKSELYDSLSSKSIETSLKTGKRLSDANVTRLSEHFYENNFSNYDTNKTFKGASPNILLSKRNNITFMEDELYIKGNTAIWSRGILNNNDGVENGRKTVCSYTSLQPIKHALWCTFYCERPIFNPSLCDPFGKPEEINGKQIPAVCLIDSENIRIFTEKNEDFVTAIPFEIGKVWTTEYGIFIEQELDDNIKEFEFQKATLYSLAHPLDDVRPVAINMSSIPQLLNNNNLQVVYTNENPSICMIFDNQTKLHSVYRIRKLKLEEKGAFCDKSAMTSTMEISNKLKSRCSIWENLKNSNYLPVPSPISSRPASISSFGPLQSRSFNSMATISRCHSPAPSSRTSRLNHSLASGRNSNYPSNSSFFDSSKAMAYLHSTPMICLDYLWTEQLSSQDEALSCPASKVFLCDDLTGQWYLCFIVAPKYRLYMVNINIGNDSNITFGKMNSIGVRDAVPISCLHMMAVLENNGNVSIYSGLTPVGKLHIGGTLVQHAPSPYIRRSLSRFSTPFPRRSSLLPNCNLAELKFDDHLLSPVLPDTGGSTLPPTNLLQVNFPLSSSGSPKVVLNGFQDPVENRITLRYSDGTYYRITLPILTSSSLIESCLKTLRQCLVKDSVMVVLTRWYATRNSLGREDINVEHEWELFENLLFELMGYGENKGNEVLDDCPVTPSSNPKRQKHSTSGTDDDWSFMNNTINQNVVSYFNHTLKLPVFTQQQRKYRNSSINSSAILFSSIPYIHYTFHLLYEDLKLNILRHDDLKFLANFLNKLSRDLGLHQYSIHYWKDFPNTCIINSLPCINYNEFKNVNINPSTSNNSPFSIFNFIHDLIEGRHQGRVYPYLENVNTRSKDIIQVCAVILKEYYPELSINDIVKSVEINSTSIPLEVVNVSGEYSPVEQATLLLAEKKFSLRDLDTLPPAIYLLFYGALWKCREHPPPSWPSEVYYLLWRDDLAAQAINNKGINIRSSSLISEKESEIANTSRLTTNPRKNQEPIDGMEDIETTCHAIMKLRFPDDVRVAETRKMLQSSKPVPIVLVQRPDVSDHDFIEEQEKHLYAICTRTMALSVGRGMFTLRTSAPVITEPLQIPQLCLAGKAPPRATTVELNHIDTPSNMNLWPLFHNGAANGLRITPDAHCIDNTWIMFNKPKGSVEQHMEHAGFLMALGLNGHLKNLDILSTYDYLVKLHEMTSIGILLGLSAAFRGTSHQSLTKTLSLHVEALLPPTSMELDVPQNVQVAGLLGVGLVYQGTSHRHMIEVLLSEIGRPPGPEMENSVDRESYSLAAGLALGLVTLKQGGNPLGLSDLNVPDTLHYYMVGGNRRPLTGAQKDKYKVPSFQIREGSSVNLDVTAPGATLALGLMYLGTGNKAVADWMSPPGTQYLLDFVRPDFLMFRILSRALILWDDIEPSKSWVENQVPSSIKPFCMVKPNNNVDIDYEAMNQAYCNIVTGACFAMALRFAGSADQDAFDTLLHFCHMFARLTMKSIAELAGKPTVETCLNVLLISTAMVMAGTGNLEVMRLVRLLRRRVGVSSSVIVTYGSHLATHMALGLLFLGGGRYTLSNSPGNVAALICAFYPKFPTHSNDNRYHLQAFRHLYVLAVEPRLLIPRDVHTLESCYVNLRVVKLDGSTFIMKSPGIIPDLNTLSKVAVEDERYWPVIFERGRNWDSLIKMLSFTGFIEVKQRAGCLSYNIDKFGYHSQLARTLTQSETVPWDPPPSSIISFTHDHCIKLFCDHFLVLDAQLSNNSSKLRQILTRTTYDAVVKDKLIIIPVFTYLIKVIQELRSTSTSFNMWQMKLILSQILKKPVVINLISREVVLALEQEIEEILDEWEETIGYQLVNYIKKGVINYDQEIEKIVAFITYYDLPFKENVVGKGFFEVLCSLNSNCANKTAATISRLYNKFEFSN